MVRSFNRICKVDNDNTIVFVLIIFSLFDIYMYSNIKKVFDFSSYFNSAKFK